MLTSPRKQVLEGFQRRRKSAECVETYPLVGRSWERVSASLCTTFLVHSQPAYSNLLLLWLCTYTMKHGLNKEIITYYVDKTIWIYVTRSNWSAEQRKKSLASFKRYPCFDAINLFNNIILDNFLCKSKYSPNLSRLYQ